VMPGFLMHVGATANCPHGGQVSTISTNPLVLVGGQAVATLSDTYRVAGCPFTVPQGKPQPCVNVKWLVSAAQVLVDGQPVVLQTSTGLCESAEQLPQGPPNVVATQVKARGT
jgi:uncharacterized Zn-binding protein involved in type VI secretion